MAVPDHQLHRRGNLRHALQQLAQRARQLFMRAQQITIFFGGKNQVHVGAEFPSAAKALLLFAELVRCPGIALASFEHAVGGIDGREKLPQLPIVESFLDIEQQLRLAL